MQARTVTARWMVLAVVALGLVWTLAPASLPIYDGIGNPDEPYRYVAPPHGYRHTPAPTDASAQVDTSSGRSAGVRLSTDEVGPQLSVYFPDGALARSGDAASITVTATPVAPADPLPADGRVVGNVYRVAAQVPGGSVDIVAFGDQVPLLDLRAPTARQPGPVFEHLVDGRWERSRTVRVGRDVYETRMAGLGDWALVDLTSQPATSGGGIGAPLMVAGAGVVGAGVVVLAIRRRRVAPSGRKVSR